MAMAVAPRRRRPRGDRNMFSASDDSALTKQIVATHAPVEERIDVRPLLDVVQDIFYRAASAIPAILRRKQAQVDGNWNDNALLSSDLPEILEILSHTINKISCEISCKCSGGVDAHATTMGILGILSSYPWDAKVVAALAAFAVNFGEFWLVAQLYATHPLAKAVAMLKQLPEMLEAAESLSQKYDAISDLVKAILDVANCIVQFEELPSQYISPDTPQMLSATAYIPVAAYWIIRSVVICASQISGITGKGQEYMASTTETWELSSLAHKVNNIHSHLRKQLDLCHQHIDDNKHLEAFQTLVRLFEMSHVDNLKILRALIYNKDDQLPLIEGGSSMKRVSIEVLRRKVVLLLISDLGISNKELFILEQMYEESRQNPTRDESKYEVVWLPVVDRAILWSKEKETKFLELQKKMPWYSIYHPSLLEAATIRYIKEVWRFNKKPMLVVLDPFGKVVNLNAIHMMWIWGSLAYPFTAEKEESLWKQETWRMELLVDAVDPTLFGWMSEGSYICLYGGENLDWIRRFTKKAKAVAEELEVTLEMMYMGRSNPGEKVRQNNKVIQDENLSHILAAGPDLIVMWFFWMRLQSMWESKLKQGKTSENDQIMQELMTILTYDGSEEGWVVISKGFDPKMAKGKGEAFVKLLNDVDQWKDKARDVGLVAAMDDHMKGIQTETPHHCNRLILPESSGGIPEKVVCAECGRPMEKFFMYRCCTD